jgi:DNA-binding MarR family transcriptional regulator
MLTIFTIENLYAILSGRTHSAFNKALLTHFKNNNISLSKEQWTILSVLWQEDGCSQQTLAEKTYKDKPGITRLVDNLEKENLVERRPDSKDRRLNLIFLTSQGKAIENDVMTVVEQTIKSAIEGIAPENLQIVKETFLKVYQNLDQNK